VSERAVGRTLRRLRLRRRMRFFFHLLRPARTVHRQSAATFIGWGRWVLRGGCACGGGYCEAGVRVYASEGGTR
jgi:hypothetical protein